MKPSVQERFLAKVNYDGPIFRDLGPCWVWMAHRIPQGYGHFWFNGINRMAHRVSYELFVGKIPEGLTLDHLCKNVSCVNPKHLEPVTMKENVMRGDGLTAKFAKATHCIHGHPFEGENLYAHKRGRTCKACQKARYERVKHFAWFKKRRRLAEKRYAERQKCRRMN